MRTCTRCHTAKPLAAFGLNRYYARFGARDGRAVICKECNRVASAARRVEYRRLMGTSVKVAMSVFGSLRRRGREAA